MKVSVVVTVCNEGNTIKALLDSLLSQTKKPDEIVIADGGSSDNTVQIIEDYQLDYPFINLIKSRGSIAHGRNTAISNAKYDIIAQIDGGCVANKHWLKRITRSFKSETVGLVAGFYEMTGDMPFQKAVALFMGIPKQRFDPRCFLPSARSVAFRKIIWDRVGGYSEKLARAGEDTLFNFQVIRDKVNIVRVENAIVTWEVPNNLIDAAKKFFSYAKGDAQAGIWWHPAQKLATHNIKISLIFARYLIGLILLLMSFLDLLLFFVLVVGFIFYVFWTIWKMEDVISDMKVKMWIPIIQITSDLAVMGGFAAGIINR